MTLLNYVRKSLQSLTIFRLDKHAGAENPREAGEADGVELESQPMTLSKTQEASIKEC